MERLTLARALGVAGGLIVLAAVFQLFFRYEYLGSGRALMRIDRVTGGSCFMPCRPTPPPSPSPAQSPPNYAADDQRAIALAQRQLSAVAVEAQGNTNGYEWATYGRYTSNYALLEGTTDWEAVKAGGNPLIVPTKAPSGPAPVRVVCFCSKKGAGFYWEVHLDTREVYQIDGNRDLEKRYGMETR